MDNETQFTALNRVVERIERQNEETAFVGCALLDRFRQSRTPENLDEIKNFIRMGLQDARRNLRTFKDRDRRRSSHFSRRAKRRPALAHRINGHITVLGRRTELYEKRRAILKEVADAVLWELLDQDVVKVGYLYKDGGHDLPTDIGLAGVIEFQAQLHGSGNFLVMENDLTRCAGVGDLTIVRADGAPCTPILLEVKTKSGGKELVEGMTVGIIGITASTDDPLDGATMAQLSEILGEGLDPEATVPERGDVQGAEISRRTQLIARATKNDLRPIRIPQGRLKTLRNVAGRALRDGSSFDLSERGVVHFAIAPSGSVDVGSAMQKIRDGATDFLGPEILAGVSHQVHERQDLSGTILPIALWDISVEQRAAVLSGTLIVGTIVRKDLLNELFAERGISVEESEETWRLTKGAVSIDVDRLHVRTIRLGIVFGGISPAGVVAEFEKRIFEIERTYSA